MVDNVTLNSGTGGAVAAADDISSVFFQRVKLTLGADGVNDGDVSDSNPMPVDDAGGSLTVDNGGTFAVQDDNALNLIDTNNSSTTPLGISAVFTGTGTDVSEYSAVTIQIFADQDSATDGMTFQFSTDNSNWDDVYTFDHTASDTRRFQFPVTAQHFRIVYTNGTTGQGAFRLQTILHRQNVLTSIHRLTDSVSQDRSAQIVKAALMAQTNPGAGSAFTNIAATNGGNLKVSVEEFGASLPAGTNNIGDVDIASLPDEGQQTMAASISVAIASDQSAVTVDGSGVTQPVSAASLPLPTGAATSAAQLPDGHNVTIDNSTGAAAVNIQDGGNSITVDGTVTANLSATDNAVLDQIEVNTSYGDNTGGGVEAGSLRVTIANDSTGLVSVDDNGGSLTVDNGGTFATQATLQTGSSLVGDVGLSGARTSGGTTLYKNIDVDESEDQIKGTAGQVYWIHAVNVSATVKYLKFYNATAASVTVGTTVPDLTFPVPTQGDTNGAGFTLSIPNGIAFGTAITVAATTGVADNDSGAPGANEVIVNLGYA